MEQVLLVYTFNSKGTDLKLGEKFDSWLYNFLAT